MTSKIRERVARVGKGNLEAALSKKELEILVKTILHSRWCCFKIPLHIPMQLTFIIHGRLEVCRLGFQAVHLGCDRNSLWMFYLPYTSMHYKPIIWVLAFVKCFGSCHDNNCAHARGIR